MRWDQTDPVMFQSITTPETEILLWQEVGSIKADTAAHVWILRSDTCAALHVHTGRWDREGVECRIGVSAKCLLRRTIEKEEERGKSGGVNGSGRHIISTKRSLLSITREQHVVKRGLYT